MGHEQFEYTIYIPCTIKVRVNAENKTQAKEIADEFLCDEVMNNLNHALDNTVEEGNIDMVTYANTKKGKRNATNTCPRYSRAKFADRTLK